MVEESRATEALAREQHLIYDTRVDFTSDNN